MLEGISLSKKRSDSLGRMAMCPLSLSSGSPVLSHARPWILSSSSPWPTRRRTEVARHGRRCVAPRRSAPDAARPRVAIIEQDYGTGWACLEIIELEVTLKLVSQWGYGNAL